MNKVNYHNHIVVEGPIGVGKTSLARRLAASLGSELVLEQANENPFLERFYQDRKSAALPTQLYFLFQRARQLKNLRQGDMFQPAHITDFLMEKDRLFARLTLDNDEYQLYEQVYAQLTVDVPVPDLVVYLQAPIDVLRARIASRGIVYEQYMDTDYLQQLVDAYARFFHQYDMAPLLIVNAAGIDLVSNDQDYEMLYRQVTNIKSGRHYFNPLPGPF